MIFDKDKVLTPFTADKAKKGLVTSSSANNGVLLPQVSQRG